jgi:anaphase-promoting complex subunit 3
LLGKLWNAHGDNQKAIDYYIEALKLNPFMWDAFTDLADMGSAVRPLNIFKLTPEMLTAMSHSMPNGNGAHLFQSQESFEAKNPFVSTPDVDPFNPSLRNGGDVGLNLGGSNLLSKLNGSMPSTNGHGAGSVYPDVETPTSNGQNVRDDDVMMGDTGGGPVVSESVLEMPNAPGRKIRMQPFGSAEEPPKMRPITSRSRLKMGPETEVTEIPRPIGQNGHKRTVSGHSTHHIQHPATVPLDPTAAPPRRSVRLLNSISSQIRPSSSRLAAATSRDPDAKERRELRKVKATGTKGKTGSVSTVGRVVSGNRKPTVEISESSSKPDSRPASAAAGGAPPLPKMAPPTDIARDRESVEWLLDLLLKLATGYAQLSRYQNTQALESFSMIPPQQRDSPWVLMLIGKAHYENQDHANAEKTFLRLREKAPSHIEGMEYLSSALWQLKKPTELAHLAHILSDQDRLSPEAWCTMGNAFSAQRDHDQAVKCFARATQLDPKFAYAFFLQGQEHMANEEFDKATHAFRSAIGANNRHYNGWFGLGQVYEKLGKYDVAEKHYRWAAQINPTNALLAVRVGGVSHHHDHHDHPGFEIFSGAN